MMYLSEFCDVRYEEKYIVVLVEWKKFCCYEDYRKPLEYALDVIKKHENCNYAADTRNGFENIPEYTAWVAEYFMPKAEVEERFAVIDDELVWYGGMNLLGKVDIWDNLMRIKNHQVASELMEIALGMTE